MDPRKLYQANLELIDQIVDVQCRRSACYGADAEDFRGEVHVKLLEDDCRRLARCSDPGVLKTYLVVVVANLFRDHRNQRWGKFRVSVAARRLGPVAMQLETLLRRDGWGLEEAVRILRENLGAEGSAGELRELSAELSRSPRRRFESDRGLELMAVEDGDRLPESEGAARAERVREALGRALESLEAEDRLLVKMRFRDRLKVSEIARMLGRNQRRLYTELAKIFRRLEGFLIGEGLEAEAALSAIGWDGWDGLLESLDAEERRE